MRQLARRLYWSGRRRLGGRGLARFGLVRRLEGLVRSAIRSDVVEVLGHRMYLDARDGAELSTNGIYEPLTTTLVRREVREGHTVLDVGAHIGYYTLLFARQVGPRGRVFAFEPAPNAIALLERNLGVNGYRNVTLIPKAVSDVAGPCRLYVDEANVGDSRIYAPRDGRRFVPIETVRLDDALASHPGPIHFIKMDIQGAEHAALRGMLGLLRAHAAVKVVTEFWPYGLKAGGAEPAAYLNLLLENGFHLFNVDERAGRIVPVSPKQLLTRYPPTFTSATNLLCLRR
jgi:FkbM family methyltransferase